MVESSPDAPFQSLWDENYELVRTYLKRLGYLRPDHISAKEFFDSTLSQVYTNFMRRVDGFDGRNWEAWLYKLVWSTTRDEVRTIIGRFKGTRFFVPLDELDHQPFIAGHTARQEHEILIRQILELHEKAGARATKSARAIKLRYYEGMPTEGIAGQLGTTKAYVEQLFSHDYPELYKLLQEKFGLNGKAL